MRVSEQASEWLVAFCEGEVESAGQQDFLRWLLTSPQHVAAYLRVSALWECADVLRMQYGADLDEVVVRSRALPQVRRVDVAASTAWTEGKLVLDSVPLREVVEDLNRTGVRRVIVEDETIIDFHIKGAPFMRLIILIAIGLSAARLAQAANPPDSDLSGLPVVTVTAPRLPEPHELAGENESGPQRAAPVLSIRDYPIQDHTGFSDPRLRTGTRFQSVLVSGFVNVLIVADARKLQGYPIRAIAAYVAALALSQGESLGACNELASITELFATDCNGRARPEWITPVDTAYLKGLYATDLIDSAYEERIHLAHRLALEVADQDGP